MKKSGHRFLSAAVGVAAGLVGCFGISFVSNAATAGPAVSAASTYDLALLYSDSSSIARTNGSTALIKIPGLDGVRLDTLRLMNQTDTADFYVGLNDQNLLCLIVHTPGKDWQTASTCTTPTNFDKFGVGLRTYVLGDSTEAYVLPDSGLKKSSVRFDDRITSMGNLVIVDPHLSSAERSELRKSVAGEPLSIFPVPVEDSVR